MNYLILLRHGQSKWNLENKFTGMTDVDLTDIGIEEAENAGKLIKRLQINIDEIHSSILKRANKTAEIAINQTEQKHLYKDEKLIMIKDSSLNERDYGDLVGLNKSETAKKYGKKQVHIWRRSFDVPPPGGESLKQVIERVTPYYNKAIKEKIIANKNILVVAHGNSLRALLVCINLHQPREISNIEIPTGKPLLITFKNSKIISHKYLN